EANTKLQMLPTFRADTCFKIDQPGFLAYLSELEAASGVTIIGFDDVLAALHQRLDFFAAQGCCLSDHSLETPVFKTPPTTAELDRIINQRRNGAALSHDDVAGYSTAVLLWLGREYARRGWVMQLHLGAQRDISARGR